MQPVASTMFDKQHMTETAKEVLDLWWLWLVKGALAILFGAAAWIWPGLTATTLIWILGAYIIIDGIVSIIGFFRHGEVSWGRRILLLIWGVIEVIAGIVLWVSPGAGAVTLMIVFGVWALMTGVFLLVGAFTSDGHLMSPWVQGLLGILGILVGIYMIVDPGRGALATIWAIGTTAIIYGISLIFASFRMRSARNSLEDSLKASTAS